MPVTFTNVCPPIPIRCFDWSCALDDDEDASRGWGATKREALCDLLDNEEVDTIAAHFGITVQFVDPCRGPEHGHWVAFTESGDRIEAPWRETAIADLAFKIAEKDL